MKDAYDVLTDRETEPTIAELNEAEAYYLDHEGSMETADESAFRQPVLTHLADNFVSPVQSVKTDTGEHYYGVIEYTEGDEWFGFVAYDERSVGRRVIGVREAVDADPTNDAALPHATAGDPTGSFADSPDASYSELVEPLQQRYAQSYGEDRDPLDDIPIPSETEPVTKGVTSGPCCTHGQMQADICDRL